MSGPKDQDKKGGAQKEWEEFVLKRTDTGKPLKPLIALISTKWCTNCSEMKKFWPQIENSLIIDVEGHEKFVRDLGITSVPTMVGLRPEGVEPILMHTGALSQEEVVRKIKNFLSAQPACDETGKEKNGFLLICSKEFHEKIVRDQVWTFVTDCVKVTYPEHMDAASALRIGVSRFPTLHLPNIGVNVELPSENELQDYHGALAGFAVHMAKTVSERRQTAGA